MNPLDLLRMKLDQSFHSAIHETAWGRPDLMSAVLREVCSAFDTSFDNASRRSIGKCLQSFRESAALPTFLDLKYACFGISQKTGRDGWTLLEDARLFDILLTEIRSQAQNPRRLRKCFQGLLSGYFDYNVFQNTIPDQGRKNWLRLRAFLGEQIPAIQSATPKFSWVEVISRHANLLEDNPCDRYGASLAQGEYTDLKSVLKVLAISRTSWIWEMIVMARLRAVCSFDDSEFKKQLASCLLMIQEDCQVPLAPVLKKKCAAMLLRRYEACESHPENGSLGDMAVRHIGNPWIERSAWEAHEDLEAARAMVDTWLKRRLVSDFFRMLSRNRPADRERLNYWMQFMHKIEDIWFALSPHALNDPAPGYAEFRQIARDRIMAFKNGRSERENALIMRIGDLVFIETSAHDACLVFKSKEVTFDLDKKWVCIGSQPVYSPFHQESHARKRKRIPAGPSL